ncbi:sporulation protein [Dactylosporangium darangshiense]
MVFRSLRRRMGVGGPAVDTVLDNPVTRPGDALSGAVCLIGGERDVEIERIVLTLVTREGASTAELAKLEIENRFRLGAGELHEVPLRLQIPLRTPVTHVYGERVPGLAVGVRTDLEVAFAADPEDMDPVAVHPLPAEAAVLEALRELGFRLKSADVSQTFEFWTAPQYQDIATEIAVGFVTRADELELVLDGRARTHHDRREHVDWTAEVDRLMRQIGHN